MIVPSVESMGGPEVDQGSAEARRQLDWSCVPFGLPSCACKLKSDVCRSQFRHNEFGHALERISARLKRRQFNLRAQLGNANEMHGRTRQRASQQHAEIPRSAIARPLFDPRPTQDRVDSRSTPDRTRVGPRESAQGEQRIQCADSSPTFAIPPSRHAAASETLTACRVWHVIVWAENPENLVQHLAYLTCLMQTFWSIVSRRRFKDARSRFVSFDDGACNVDTKSLVVRPRIYNRMRHGRVASQPADVRVSIAL